ncbi:MULTISPECIES: META domain-containing protein [unclassified Helicobacter]|uniref:META domain-containing protein n=1 Tax=unclassified Helicobacter TaxID=2593540 RepID=UPI0013150FB6|nr:MULTISPECIES: META domain-containing protein [unclassified Helicobacter]
MIRVYFLVGLVISLVSSKEYVLEKLVSRNMTYASNDNVSFVIEGNKIYGSNGCNRFFGNLNKNQITNLGNTMMACSKEDMRLETEVMGIIKNSHLSFYEDRVLIKNNYGEMVFKAR